MTIGDTSTLKRSMSEETNITGTEILIDCLKQGLIEESSILRNGCFPVYIPKAADIHMAWIEITSICNLRCRHCYNCAGETNNTQLSLADYSFVVDELYKLGVQTVQLIGGEPLSVGEQLLKTMLSYLCGKFKTIEVFTNATLLTESMAAFFAENNIHVAASVYSYDAHEHDGVTQVSGSHAKTLCGIELLRRFNVHYRIANVLMKGVLLRENNTKLFTLNPHKDVVRMSGRGTSGLLTAELIRKRLITRQNFSKPLNPQFIERLMKGHNCFVKCVYVSADLTVYPCVMERRIAHGNMREKGLHAILNTEIQNLSKNNIEGCKDCEFRYACFDCRPDAFSDNIHEKPWYCTYDPYTGDFTNEDDFIEAILSS